MTTPCLRLATNTWLPHVMLSGKYPHEKVAGSMVSVMDIITKKLGVCYEFVIPEDHQFGQFVNGSWTGIVGQLLKGEADMSGVIVSINHARSTAVDFGVPLYVNDNALAYKRPTFEPDITGFVKPYTVSTWVLLFISMFFVFAGLLFIQVHRYNILKKFRQTEELARHPSSSLDDDLWRTPREGIWLASLWSCGSFLAQAIPKEPRAVPVQLLAGLWLVLMLIVSTVYRSNLKAMLILPRLDLPFDNMAELVETDIATFSPRGSVVYQAVMEAPESSPMSRLKKQLITHTDVHKFMRDMAAGEHATLVDRDTILFLLHRIFLQTQSCTLYVASETFFGASSLSLAFPRGSPLRQKVDPIVYRLREFGILDHLLHGNVRHAKTCLQRQTEAPDGSRRPLALKDFYGVFCVYSAGIILGILSFLVEKLFPNWK